MKKILAVAIIAFALFFCGKIYAEGEAASNTEWKKELRSDHKEITEQRQEMKQDAQTSRAEEKQLRQQIKDAIAAGDTEKANRLRAQLKAMHKENVQDMQQDKKDLLADRKELKADLKEARQEGNLPPPGVDRDDNPPGPKGGPGTNWENPPGPKGGPGASPDRRHK